MGLILRAQLVSSSTAVETMADCCPVATGLSLAKQTESSGQLVVSSSRCSCSSPEECQKETFQEDDHQESMHCTVFFPSLPPSLSLSPSPSLPPLSLPPLSLPPLPHLLYTSPPSLLPCTPTCMLSVSLWTLLKWRRR